MNFSTRIYQFDIFRFIAAIMVVLFHYFFVGPAEGIVPITFLEIAPFFKYGYLGLDLFFIISGFVILLTLKDDSLIRFLKSRFIRLYPIYWTCVLITFFVTLVFGFPRVQSTVKELFVNFTMFQGIFNIKSIDGVYWSLLVELKFYIIILIYLIVKKFFTIRLNYIIVSWTLVSVLYIFFRETFLFRVLNYFFILDWSPYFIAGMVFYQIYKENIQLNKIFLLVVCLLASIYNSILRIDLLESTIHSSFSGFMIAAIICGLYASVFLVTTGKLKFLNRSIFLKLGLITYPLYLLHQFIGYVIFNKLGAHINKYLLLFCTMVLMLGVSYFIIAKLEPILSDFLKQKLKLNK